MDTLDSFGLFEIFVLLNPFMIFIKLACEPVQQVAVIC